MSDYEQKKLKRADPRKDGRDQARTSVGSDKLLNPQGAIAAGSITLAMLATGVSPSHVAKFGGTVTWSGSGATLAPTVTGVASTDIVMATIQTKPSQAAYLVRATPSTNTITFELSAANTSNDAVIAYVVFRAAS